MNYITGTNRNQILMQCMEDYIAGDNPVRVIDALVDALDLKELKFIKPKPEYKEGESASILDKGGQNEGLEATISKTTTTVC
ncbi:MAG: hypothetical protein ABI723_11580 [Bacteroidia bacterium]